MTAIQVPTCTGACCAVVYMPTPIKDWPVADADWQTISDMLLPIGLDEAAERNAQHGAIPADHLVDRQDVRGHLYTCRNWDTETRKCVQYDTRPKMCSEYPYEGTTCSFCGGAS